MTVNGTVVGQAAAAGWVLLAGREVVRPLRPAKHFGIPDKINGQR